MMELEVNSEEVLALLEQGQPLSDLLRELIYLRRWKEKQAKAQRLEALRMERMLSRICDSCKDTASRWIRHQNGSTDDLPVELIHTIFQYTIPPSTLLDPMAARGISTPWILATDAKMGLARVSRRWYSSVLPFLYEEVSFRHPAQVHSFANTLRTHPDLRHLVKKIVVDCPAPKEIRERVIGDLVYIITQCTKLGALAFTDSLFAMDSEDDLQRVVLYAFPSALSSAIRGLAGSLTCFEQLPQGGTPHFTWPFSCLSSAPLLTTLVINIDHDDSLESIELSTLEELDVSRQYSVPRGSNQRFAKWKLPHLKRLVLPLAIDIDIQGRLIAQFGKSITYLEFCDYLDITSSRHKTPWKPYDLDQFCPVLQHLVFQASVDLATTAMETLPSHPTLTYVDVWINSPNLNTRQNILERCRRRRIAGQIQWNVRLLDRSLNAIRRLPELFSPRIPADELPSIHIIPGLSITHAAWGVYRSDLDTLYPPEDSLEKFDSEDSLDSDSSYLTESDPSDDDSMTESEEDASEGISIA